jgi:hypothetical protein
MGWVAGLVVVSVVVLLLANGSDQSGSTSSNVVNWLKLALGVLFWVMAAKQWAGRPKQGVAPTMPKWMAAIDGFTPAKSLGFGGLLSGANPKNLALTLASAASIAQYGLDASQTVIADAVFVVIASLSVAGPVILFVVAPGRAAKPLGEVKTFMSEHNAVIMMVVLLLLGAKLIGGGIAGISN